QRAVGADRDRSAGRTSARARVHAVAVDRGHRAHARKAVAVVVGGAQERARREAFVDVAVAVVVDAVAALHRARVSPGSGVVASGRAATRREAQIEARHSIAVAVGSHFAEHGIAVRTIAYQNGHSRLADATVLVAVAGLDPGADV